MDDKVAIKESIGPRNLFDVTNLQRRKIMFLCKEIIAIEEISKLLEKRKGSFNV